MRSSARNSDSDYAYRLQMEEAVAASLSSRSRTPQRPPSPPVVATCGVAIVVENGTTARNKGFDFKKALGEGSSKGKGKGKIQETVTGVRRDDNRNPNIRVGNSQNAPVYRVKVPSPVIQSQETNGDVLYRLYFKGLVSDEIGNGKGKMMNVIAGFGVAICDSKDNLLFETKGALVNRGTNRQEAEIKALTRGFNEALKLDIKRIVFLCDTFPIFQFVTGRWSPKQKKIAMLMSDLQQIRQQFTVSLPALVAGYDVKFAYKLARESIASQFTPPENPRQGQAKAARKVECVICFNNTGAANMFSINKCRHRFCFQCVKQHVEVKLLQGMVPKCPHDGCRSELFIDACGKLLTPKLSELWKQRIKENAIPVTDRVYCPYPRCSALMSRTKISESANSLLSAYPTSGVRRCVKCRGLFCVDCKVPWHGKLSCTEYKKLHPNPPADEVKLESLANNNMWRQCSECQHMIELTQGCNHITCRCGFEFCYNCGGVWNKKLSICDKGCPAANVEYILGQDPAFAHMGPNFYFDDSDDDEDYDNDEEDDYLAIGRAMMNDLGLEIPEDFDPFFDLPDGTIFHPNMLSPKTRARFYADDDSDDMEPGQSHFPHNTNAPFGNAPPADDDDDDCPYFGKYGKYTPVYDSDGYEIEDYTNPFNPEYYPQF